MLLPFKQKLSLQELGFLEWNLDFCLGIVVYSFLTNHLIWIVHYSPQLPIFPNHQDPRQTPQPVSSSVFCVIQIPNQLFFCFLSAAHNAILLLCLHYITSQAQIFTVAYSFPTDLEQGAYNPFYIYIYTLVQNLTKSIYFISDINSQLRISSEFPAGGE